jgi:hypothetical protein
MAEPLDAARGIEPSPIPDDIPSNAPIRGDVERGYTPTEAESDRGRKGSGSGTTTPRGSRSRSAGNKDKEKEKGKGLTEGDAGGSGSSVCARCDLLESVAKLTGEIEMDEIPKNNLLLVMPR